MLRLLKQSLRIICLLIYYIVLRHLPAGNHRGTGWLSVVRGFVCRGIFLKAGKRIIVEKGAYVGTGSGITIGSNAGIGENAKIYGPVSIGDDVMMGPDVIIYTVHHRYDDTTVPMRVQGRSPVEPVTIEEDVWVGARAIIMPGVTVGRGAIVGAGAVVTSDVESMTVVGGVPARVIKHRTAEKNN